MKNSSQKVFFCTFGNELFSRALKRIELQAINFGVYDNVFIYTENSFDPKFTFWLKEKAALNPRGFAYWSWKPMVVLQALRAAKDGDIVHYADAGCHLNKNGFRRFKYYIKKVNNSKDGILTFSSVPPKEIILNKLKLFPEWLERQWTKGDLIKAFGLENKTEIIDTHQIEATSFFIKKNSNSLKIIEDWNEKIQHSFSLIDDSPSKTKNSNDFIDHRHDQSLFSILLKKNNHQNTLSSYEYNHPWIKSKWFYRWRMKAHNRIYPILAKRDLGFLYSKIFKKIIIYKSRLHFRHDKN